VTDEERISEVLTSDEAFECQECHWRGRQRDLVRATNDDGSVELPMSGVPASALVLPGRGSGVIGELNVFLGVVWRPVSNADSGGGG